MGSDPVVAVVVLREARANNENGLVDEGGERTSRDARSQELMDMADPQLRTATACCTARGRKTGVMSCLIMEK